ncbi:membrane protein [soil metagenome]
MVETERIVLVRAVILLTGCAVANPRTDDLTAAFNKVPAVTLVFWIIKIFATTVGETAADVLSTTFNLGLVVTSVVMAVLLTIALIMQFRARTYVPTLYWITVVFISVVGTLISDNLVDNLGVTLVTTTIIFSAALIGVFIWWYLSEHTLSVHSIYSTRRELFYWGAILFTFSLGTSGGDLISESFGLGYGIALGLFAAGIAIVYALYRLHVINGVLAFWAGYILTRPLGASAGDLLTQAPSDGGLGMGRLPVTAVILVVIIALVIYPSVQERKHPPVPVAM